MSFVKIRTVKSLIQGCTKFCLRMFTVLARCGYVLAQKMSAKTYSVAVSFVKIGAMEAIFCTGHKHTSVRTFQISCPIWVKFGVRNPRTMLHSIFGLRGNRCREARTFVTCVCVCGITFMRVPWNYTTFWKWKKVFRRIVKWSESWKWKKKAL